MNLTKQHFALFKSECLRLQKEWGLLDWRIDFGKEDLDNAAARISVHLIDGVAEIDINDKDINSANIKVHAKHEMLHLLLAKLSTLAKERMVSNWEIECEEHAIIRKLEKIIK